jgi:serine/threonine-protein kinase HipA
MPLAIERDRRHYVLERIAERHFRQTAEKAGMPEALVDEAIREIHERAEPALQAVANTLPAGFPESIHAAVNRGVRARLRI